MSEGRLAPREYAEGKQHLTEDLRDAVIVNLAPQLGSTSTKILETSPVRSADALHVACPVECKTGLFVYADKRQIVAAKKAELIVTMVWWPILGLPT